MTKNWKKITAEKKFNFFFTYPEASIKYVQVTEDACSSQKRPSNTSKHELFKKNFYFCGSFLPSWIRIRIPIPDPDPLARLTTDPIRIRIRNPGPKALMLLLIVPYANLFIFRSRFSHVAFKGCQNHWKMLQAVRLDRRAIPRTGERVPYVVVYGEPGLPLIQAP